MEVERSKCNTLERLFNNYPVFYFSKDIDLRLNSISLDKEFIVKPSKIRRFVATIFVCFGLFFWMMFLSLIVKSILMPISAFFLILTSVWIGFIVWTVFLDPQQSYKIVVNSKEIFLGSQTYSLSDISEYLLMEGSWGRHGPVTTLVLFIDNKDVKKFDLTNMNKSGQEIVKRIEYFKHENGRTTSACRNSDLRWSCKLAFLLVPL